MRLFTKYVVWQQNIEIIKYFRYFVKNAKNDAFHLK